MAGINTMAASQRFPGLFYCNSTPAKHKKPFLANIRARNRRSSAAAVAKTHKRDNLSLQSEEFTDQHAVVVPPGREGESSFLEQSSPSTSQIAGFGGSGVGFSLSSSTSVSPIEGEVEDKMVDRAINASIVLAAGTFAVTKLLTIDMDYWHGWTVYEIVRYAPQHNWTAYEEALKTNPVLAKMMISGTVYSIGDWIAQCYAGKPLFEFDRSRMFRSGLTGFFLHGSLSHYYYEICEFLFPFQDWWVVPVKVAFDQTIWTATWNSIYYVVLGFLRLESPADIFSELKATFWPMLTAGWKLWPFAHLITYGVIPVEQRLLWVDCVELVWVMILSTYSNEKSEARHSEAMSELGVESQSAVPEEIAK